MGARARELLDEDRVVQKVPTRAAVLDGLVRSEQSLFAEPAPDRAIGHSPLVPFGDPRLDFLLDETAHLLAEEVVLLGEDLASHDPPNPCRKVRTPDIKNTKAPMVAGCCQFAMGGRL